MENVQEERIENVVIYVDQENVVEDTISSGPMKFDDDMKRPSP